MQEHDVIIIGSGLAGLTAGAQLAKEGKKVLLIEQHNKVGGCATVFHRKIRGRKTGFEVGLHEMDGLDSAFDPKKRIFEELEVNSNVEFIRVPEFFKITNGRFDLTIPHNIPEAINVLSKAFPDEIEAIETFFKDIKQTYSFLVEGNLEKLASISQTSIGEYLDTITDNEDLKFVLTGNLGYYHDDPYSLSMIFFSAPQISYFTGGGHFIKGGSQSLSDYLASVISNNNGTVILKHLVTEIITENKRAKGVKYIRTKQKDDEDREEFSVYAKVVLANAALPNVVNDLVPSLQNTEYQKKVNSLKLACSILSLYLGFSKPTASLGHNAYSIFVLSEDLTKLKDFYPQERMNDYSKKGFTFVDYSMIDSQINEEGIYTGVICTIDYLDHWIHLNETEYNNKKEEVAQTLIDRLETIIPGIKDIIIYSEVGTPKTMVRYTLNPEGTVYGFAQIPDQVGPMKHEIRKPPINNLYCASAWTGSGGFSGAIMAGYTCALKILKDCWKD
ncbi:MAG: NAD(P)/FAD-dependent oxidoreductase [Candidatus Heimdallarchaeota archaeon]|nr:MAG: NAD(P)/FAD-dependent oxidoreductase [Candidatus Heimdallarchaeota archaeon]